MIYLEIMKNTKMKKFLFLILFLAYAFAGQSQTIKKHIGFIPYTDPDQAEAKNREFAYKTLYDAALRVFVNTQRFEVVDRGSFDIVKIEKEFQKGEDLANVEIIEQGKVAAAELLAVAKLSTLTIAESDDGEGFSVYITAEFKQIDVKTGRAINAFPLRANAVDKQESMMGLSNNRITTVEEAISKAVQKMESDLEKWIKRSFPMILKVVEVDDEQPFTLIVDGGSNVGLNTRHKMKVISLKKINGKNLTSTIGRLSFLKEGVGEELTYLKMSSKKDWQAFLKKWNANADNIYVTEDL